jgi:protocatechuate 3,4-dioxygenase beta subunit
VQHLFLVLGSTLLLNLCACSQNNTKSTGAGPQGQKEIKVGGPCEGCEAIYESTVSFDRLNSIDTLPDFNEPGPKIEISGIVYQRDGKTPAKDVIIYVYHTDQKGNYSTRGNAQGWGKRHGYIRGWMKTDKNGFYQFYTLLPAAYPSHRDPQHIHITVKEPGKTEYWLDEFLFDDDPLLTTEQRTKQEKRGGSGIIKLSPQPNGIAHGTRHIILGLNVADYPYSGLPKLSSGLAIGDNCPAFDPFHLSGADSGKRVCPMCKYGFGQGIMVWFNHANLDQMGDFAKRLESEMERRGEKNLRVFLVYMNPFYNEINNGPETGIMARKISKWCEEEHLKKVAMLWIPSPTDAKSAGLFHINPKAKNTVLVYKKRKVTAKWVNIEYDTTTLNAILQQFRNSSI